MLVPLAGHEAADLLIRQVARRQWLLLLLVKLGSSMVKALADGTVPWASNPLLSRFPWLVAWLDAVPAVPLFLALLALAVLLQAATCLRRCENLVRLGYSAACCRAEATARIFSYPRASGYRWANSRTTATPARRRCK